MLAQELGSYTYKIVKSTGCLQCGSCRYHRHYDKHHVDRQIARLKSEDEDKDEDTHHAVDAETDTAYARTFKDESQYDGKL